MDVTASDFSAHIGADASARPKSDRRSVFAIRVLDGDFAVPEREEIAARHLHALAVFLRASERPF